MRAGGGKQKGAGFERDVCKILSLWVSGGKREDLFWRSAMSGGRATVGRKRGKDHAQHAGDITATHPDGHALTDRFYVECKSYADLKFGSLMLKNVGALAGFWKVAVTQAALYQRAPMMIVKQNAGDIIVVVPCAAAHLAPGAGHLLLNPAGHIARLHIPRVDLYLLSEIVKKPFDWRSADDLRMLAPGELQKIMHSKPFGRIDTPAPDSVKPAKKLVRKLRSMKGTIERAKPYLAPDETDAERLGRHLASEKVQRMTKDAAGDFIARPFSEIDWADDGRPPKKPRKRERVRVTT